MIGTNSAAEQKQLTALDAAKGIRLDAEAELQAERRREDIEKEKARLRRRKWWHRFIPVITITWRK